MKKVSSQKNSDPPKLRDAGTEKKVSSAELRFLSDQIVRLAEKSPGKAATVLTRWISRERIKKGA